MEGSPTRTGDSTLNGGGGHAGRLWSRVSPKKAQSASIEPPPVPPRPGASTANATDEAESSSMDDLIHIKPPPRRTVDTAMNGQAGSVSASRSTNASTSRLQGLISSASSAGFEWSKKNAERVHGKWKARQSSNQDVLPQQQAPRGHWKSPSIHSFASSSTATNSTSTDPGTAASGKLPATLFGVRVPDKRGMAFGIDLETAVQQTRIRDTFHRPPSNCPLSGDEARRWLPAIAYRCIEYLDQWGKQEEGILRVPGSSGQINQLRLLFDAGCDADLREIHPGDLDPHAVSSVFKAWLRDLPSPLLSVNVDFTVQSLRLMTLDSVANEDQANSSDGVLVKVIPREHFYLLRALGHLLARLSQHVSTTKMTLANMIVILSPSLRMPPALLKAIIDDRETVFGPSQAESPLLELYEDARSGGGAGSQSPTLTNDSHPSSPVTPSDSFVNIAAADALGPDDIHRSKRDSSQAEILKDSATSASLSARTPIYERFARSSSSLELLSKSDSLERMTPTKYVSSSANSSPLGESKLTRSARLKQLSPPPTLNVDIAESEQEGQVSLLTVEERKRLFG